MKQRLKSLRKQMQRVIFSGYDTLKVAKRTYQTKPHLHLMVSNIAWLTGDKILRLLGGLLISVWIARYLGPAQFGTLNFAIAFVALWGPLAQLGLDTIIVRELVGKSQEKEEIIGSSMMLKLTGGISAFSLSLLLIHVFYPSSSTEACLVFIISLSFFFQTFEVLDFWFQAHVQSRFVVYARTSAFIIVTGIKISLILLHANLEAFAWAITAEVALSFLLLSLIYWGHSQTPHLWVWRLRRAKELLRESWPLLLASVSVLVYMKIDQIMLGCMVDHTILGAYSAALRLVEPFYFIATAVATSILPPLTRIKQNDSSQGYLDKLQIVYDAMTAVALPVVLVLSLCAHFIISCVYGAQYAGSEQVLRIYAWSLIPIFWGVISSQHLLVTKKVHVSFYRTFIGGLVNVALNFLLIPLYGGNGAAWASLIAYTTATLTIGLFHESQQVRMMLISLFPWPRRWTLTIH